MGTAVVVCRMAECKWQTEDSDGIGHCGRSAITLDPDGLCDGYEPED